MTLAEAAAYLDTTARHVRRLYSERRLAFYRVGQFVRFSQPDLDAFLACLAGGRRVTNPVEIRFPIDVSPEPLQALEMLHREVASADVRTAAAQVTFDLGLRVEPSLTRTIASLCCSGPC